jgi:hypothetical protein
MHTKPSAILMAFALGAVLCASGASADLRYSITDAENCAAGNNLCLTSANANPTWGDDPGEETIILEKPLFVTGGGAAASSRSFPASPCAETRAPSPPARRWSGCRASSW